MTTATSTTTPIITDGEWSNRTTAQEGLWVGIDVIGTVRNIGTAIGCGAELGGMTAMATVINGAAVPILLTLGGVLILGSAAFHTIPKAHEEYYSARNEYELVKKDKGHKKLAKEGLTVAKLGLANQYLFGTMGAGLLSNGVISLMGPVSAQLFGFHAVVGSGAVGAAGAALGAVYSIRGAVVLGRSIYNLKYLNQFETEYKSCLKLTDQTNDSLETAVNKGLQKIKEFDNCPSALMRRIGEKCGNAPTITATLEDKITYLAEVDKGIHEKKLQQKISLIIGIAMIIGGLAAVAATIATGGIPLIIIGLTSAVFFILMESIYASYDSSWLFENLRNACYTPSAEITKLIDTNEKVNNMASTRLPPRSHNFSITSGINVLQESLQALTNPIFFNLAKTA